MALLFDDLWSNHEPHVNIPIWDSLFNLLMALPLESQAGSRTPSRAVIRPSFSCQPRSVFLDGDRISTSSTLNRQDVLCADPSRLSHGYTGSGQRSLPPGSPHRLASRASSSEEEIPRTQCLVLLRQLLGHPSVGGKHRTRRTYPPVIRLSQWVLRQWNGCLE